MITVKYFANLREIAGKPEEQINTDSNVSLEQLSILIEPSQPKIAIMIRERKIMVSVNQEMAALDTLIRNGDEVAFLPPFSGGV